MIKTELLNIMFYFFCPHFVVNRNRNSEYITFHKLLQDMDPRLMQINLTGFLNAKRAREFVAELWDLLVEAQKTEDGIPPKLIQQKMEQMKGKLVLVISTLWTWFYIYFFIHRQ